VGLLGPVHEEIRGPLVLGGDLRGEHALLAKHLWRIINKCYKLKKLNGVIKLE
jgi:hypothetical protein